MHNKKVIASIITQNNKVFIAKRGKQDDLYGLWEFPGGKQEPQETEIECLKRELKEEFTIDAHVKEYLCSSYFTHKDHSYEMRMYHVPSFDGQIILNEHLEYKWVTAEELDTYPMPMPDLPIILFLKSWLK